MNITERKMELQYDDMSIVPVTIKKEQSELLIICLTLQDAKLLSKNETIESQKYK